jgi:hypothetical protein
MRYDATARSHIHPDGTSFPSIPATQQGLYPGGTVIPAYAVPARKLCLTKDGFHILPNEGVAISNEEADAIFRTVGDLATLAAWMSSRLVDVLIFYFFSPSSGTDVTSPIIVPIAVATAQRKLLSVQPDFIGGSGKMAVRDRSPSPIRPGQDHTWGQQTWGAGGKLSPQFTPVTHAAQRGQEAAWVKPGEESGRPVDADLSGLPSAPTRPGRISSVHPANPWDMPPLKYREYRVNSIPETADLYTYLYDLAHDPILGQYLRGGYVVNGAVWSYLKVPDPAWPLKHPRPARYSGPLSVSPRPVPASSRISWPNETALRSKDLRLGRARSPSPRRPQGWTWPEEFINSLGKTIAEERLEVLPQKCGEIRCPLCQTVPGVVLIKWEKCMAVPRGEQYDRFLPTGELSPMSKEPPKTGDSFTKHWLINTRLEQVAIAYSRHDWYVIFVTDAVEKMPGDPVGTIHEIVNQNINHGTLCAQVGADSVGAFLDDELRRPSGRPIVIYDSSLNTLVSANVRSCGFRCPIATVYVDGTKDCTMTGHQAPGLRLLEWVVCPRSH